MTAVRRYEPPRRVTTPGLASLTAVPTAMLFGTILLALFMFIVGLALLGVVIALAGVAATVPVVVKRNGRPMYVTVANRLRFRLAERRGQTSYRSGTVGVTPDGSHQLPGVLSRLQVFKVDSDGLGRPFALVYVPQARQWSVLLRVMPEGGALVDADTRDLWVSGWGQLLAIAGRTAGGAALVAAVIETLPDTGALLSAHVESLIRPGAPEFAARVLRAAAVELPFGVSSTVGYLTVTFSEASLGIDGRRPEAERAGEATAALGRLLPDLTVQLRGGGASSAEPLDVWSVTQRIREAFDPATVVQHAEAAAAGQPPRIPWSECGPTAHEEQQDRYFHDSGVSVVLEATGMQQGSLTDRVLDAIARPSDDAPRRRVTLLHRPLPAAEVSRLADRGVRTAMSRAQRRKGPVHAHDAADLARARRAADEEAAGAGMSDVSVLVTVTGLRTARGQIATAAAALARASTSNFQLRPVYGGQAAAFAIGLGIGFSPWSVSIVPASLREGV